MKIINEWWCVNERLPFSVVLDECSNPRDRSELPIGVKKKKKKKKKEKNFGVECNYSEWRQECCCHKSHSTQHCHSSHFIISFFFFFLLESEMNDLEIQIIVTTKKKKQSQFVGIMVKDQTVLLQQSCRSHVTCYTLSFCCRITTTDDKIVFPGHLDHRMHLLFHSMCSVVRYKISKSIRKYD